MVTPAAVEDSLPGEEEVAQVVRSLKRIRSGGPLGMREEDLKRWLREPSMETDSVKYWWRLLVRLIQTTLKDGAVPEEVVWAKMVFLPKGRGEYWGVGLVNVVWKVCAAVVNCRLKRIVTLHIALHGFRAGRGQGKETLEENLAQQLAGLANEQLFQVLLDMRKAYDSLDRGRCIEILRGYGMGKRMARLIAHHWGNLMFFPKVKRFLGTPFGTVIGVTQGEPASPMIFNIVIDAVARATLEVVCSPQEALHGMGWAAGERNLIFYADDKRIGGRDHIWVQDALTVSVAMF